LEANRRQRRRPLPRSSESPGLNLSLAAGGWLERKKGTLIGEKLPGNLLGPPFRLPSVDRLTIFFGMGDAFFRASCHRELIKRGIAGMLIIKASVVGSALMLLASCTGYLTNYQTPCVQGHVCECVQYTTVNRSWLDCRDYGRVKLKAY
jgi:hypothetical protein